MKNFDNETGPRIFTPSKGGRMFLLPDGCDTRAALAYHAVAVETMGAIDGGAHCRDVGGFDCANGKVVVCNVGRFEEWRAAL